MLSTIITSLITTIIAVGSFLGLYSPNEVFETQGLGRVEAVGGKVYKLAGSGVSASQTTVDVTSFQIAGGTQPLQMTDFGDLGCATLEPGHATRQEFISFTGVTQNSDGTARLTGVVRGLEPIPSYQASTTLQDAHAGGSTLIISNSPPCFYEGYANLDQAESITKAWTYQASTSPRYSTNPSLGSTPLGFATQQHVQDAVVGQVGTSTETTLGLVVLGDQTDLANGTASTSSGAPQVIPVRLSTTTCQTSGISNVLVASSSTGKIDSNCIDKTATSTFTGANTFNTATTTFNGAVSIQASGQNPLVLNDGVYLRVLNTTQPGASTTPQVDAAGNLSFLPAVDGYTLLTSTSTSASQLFASTTTFTAKDNLLVIIDWSGASSAANYSVKFGTATGGSNYGFKVRSQDGGLSGDSNSVAMNIFNSSAGTTSPAIYTMTIKNKAGEIKRATWSASMSSGGAAAPDTITGSGNWNVTAGQITQVAVEADISGGITIPANLRIYVFGR